MVEYVPYIVEAARSEAFLAAYTSAAEMLQRDPHRMSYEVGRGSEEPTHDVVRIVWDALGGHLDGFRRDPAFGSSSTPSSRSSTTWRNAPLSRPPPEFRAAFVGYVEWGTRFAVPNSHTGADLITEAPVPRWGWGVAPPYPG